MNKERLKDLAMKVKILRAQKGLTQKELAEKSGVSRSSVNNIETCRKIPRLALLVKLASALEVDSEVLAKFVK